MIGAMYPEARKVPTLSGWCKDDGALLFSQDIVTPGDSMTYQRYLKWWSRFRGTGFHDELLTHFNAEHYPAEGKHSSYFMAADDAFTSAYYSCPIHRQIKATYKGTQEPMYAYIFAQADPNE